MPVNPLRRLKNTSAPIFPRVRLAPTTATTDGSNSRRIDAVAASCARAAARSWCASVSSSDSATWKTPPSSRRVTS